MAVARDPFTRADSHRVPRARTGSRRDNRFFQEDFDELKNAGYLRMAIPRGSAAWG
jgi:hypothetical protein